jgi:DNA-binding XRE family transcriptional regulator
MKSDLDRHIEKNLRDKEFRYYFEKAEAKRILAQQIAAMRKAKKLSQAQLAEAVGTKQQSIARLENPQDKRMPSLEFLDRVARALGRKLAISLTH